MDVNNKILLVEDDENFGDVFKSYLEMHNYQVDLAKDGEEGLDKYKSDDYNLCILDVMMPKKDGFTLAKEIRENDKDTPIIFLTARAIKDDILEGFKIGGDDYITKPFSSEELLLRIQAILKRSGKVTDLEADQREFVLSDFHFDYPLRILSYTGSEKVDEMDQKRKLSPKEAHLLRLFCLRKNDVLTRSEALSTIWGEDNYFTARSMDVFVTKLRKYLKIDPNIEIENIHGSGFQLIVRS